MACSRLTLKFIPDRIQSPDPDNDEFSKFERPLSCISLPVDWVFGLRRVDCVTDAAYPWPRGSKANGEGREEVLIATMNYLCNILKIVLI